MNYKTDFVKILGELILILNASDNKPQAEILSDLLFLLTSEKFEEFTKNLNSNDIWGGSGAVWEVGIADSLLAQKFESQMISLIDLMEQHSILQNTIGAKRVRQLFKENISN